MKLMQSIAALAVGGVLLGGCGSHSDPGEPTVDQQLQPPAEPSNMQPAEKGDSRTSDRAIARRPEHENPHRR